MAATVKSGQDHAPGSGYRRSWLDRLLDWVERLPGPAWSYYLGAWAVAFTAGVLLARYDFSGTSRFIEAVRYYAAATALAVYVLALRHYLRLAARVAMDNFRPVYQEADSVSGEVSTLAEATYEFVYAPAVPSLLWTVGGMIALAAMTALGRTPFQLLGVAPSPVSFAFNLLIEFVMFGTATALGYAVLRTLRLVSHIYTRHARVSLFLVHPLYAFSAFTVRCGLGGLIGPLVFFTLEPGLLGGSIGASAGLTNVLGAFVLFAAPLVGAHRLLAAEKTLLLAQNAQRLREVLEWLHTAAEARDGANAPAIQNLLLGLEHERSVLAPMPTWPWQPGLFRAFLSALLIPAVIWLIQFGLGRVFIR